MGPARDAFFLPHVRDVTNELPAKARASGGRASGAASARSGLRAASEVGKFLPVSDKQSWDLPRPPVYILPRALNESVHANHGSIMYLQCVIVRRASFKCFCCKFVLVPLVIVVVCDDYWWCTKLNTEFSLYRDSVPKE